MSSFAGYCRWCEKPVMHKTFFGTLHICLTDEEKFQKARAQQMQNANKFLAGLRGAASRPYRKDKK